MTNNDQFQNRDDIYRQFEQTIVNMHNHDDKYKKTHRQ